MLRVCNLYISVVYDELRYADSNVDMAITRITKESNGGAANGRIYFGGLDYMTYFTSWSVGCFEDISNMNHFELVAKTALLH